MTVAPRALARLISALPALLLAPTLAHADPRVPTHVACVGDSITYGYAASSPSKSYPSVLQTLFGAQVTVQNFGHNGATLLSAPYGDTPYVDQTEYQSATSFVTGAGANAIVDVVILLGTNDSKPANWAPAGQPKNDQQFLKDYRAFVEHFMGLTPKPAVYLGLPLATGNSPCCTIDGTVIHDEILPLIRQVAQEKQLPTIDLNTPTTGHPEYFGDGVHPTDAAYAIVAGLVHDGLLATSASAGAGGGASGGAGGGSGGTGGMVGASVAGAASAIGGASSAGASSAGASSAGASSAGASSAGASPADAGTAGAPPVASGGSAPSGAGAKGIAGAGSGGSATVPPAKPDGGGCALSSGNRGGGAFVLAALLALAWARVRRRGRDVLDAR